ncbi:MAG: hypothetical protein LQ350_003316 [Teloschistes chrysophthalmus]|nr:MAG: hypothetical protein LQ350_003316 [Niorma chrysophthalma]
MLVEEEDPNLSGRDGDPYNLGPNPKIRNMSRAYREAKGDIVWIVDCNVWVDKTVAARLVDLLCGIAPGSRGTKYKFVHQLPLSIDVSDLSDPPYASNQANSLSNAAKTSAASNPAYFGGLLEEMFLSTSHAKFYTAISAVAVAPCTVGKSNMFRRSHLNALTASTSYRDPGIDYFSENICEDHLIGDLLWKTSVPDAIGIAAEKEGHDPNSSSWSSGSATKWRDHGLLHWHYLTNLDFRFDDNTPPFKVNIRNAADDHITMSSTSATGAFNEALNSLEKLTETRAKSNASDRQKYDRAVTKEIGVLAEASNESTEAKDILKSIQRLSVLRTKLDNCNSNYASHSMNDLFNSLLSHTDALLDPASEKALSVPTNEVGLLAVIVTYMCLADYTKSGELAEWTDWVVPIESCVAKRSFWHQKNFKKPLSFSFDRATWDFRVISGRSTIEDVWNLPDRQKTPIIAISRIGYVNQVRLLPITAKFSLQTEVMDINLQNTKDAQDLIRYLLRMECTNGFCDSNLAFHIGPETTLKDMAVSITDPET